MCQLKEKHQNKKMGHLITSVELICRETVAPSWCSAVTDRRRGTSCCRAAARLQASPFRPALSGGPPTWAQSAGMCPGPGPAALNHPDSDILSPSPSERPLWGWCEGRETGIFMGRAFTHTPMRLRFCWYTVGWTARWSSTVHLLLIFSP